MRRFDPDIVQNGHIFLFLQGVNSIRRYASLLLVLTKCFRGDETFFVLKEFERLQ